MVTRAIPTATLPILTPMPTLIRVTATAMSPHIILPTIRRIFIGHTALATIHSDIPALMVIRGIRGTALV